MTPPLRVVLASGSPRRRELLGRFAVRLEVIVPAVDETPHDGEDPVALAGRLARAKADVVTAPHRALLVAADTVVDLDGVILGKPADDAEAVAALSRLSGRAHRVHTGVAVRFGERHAAAVETTVVRFRELDTDEITAYTATGSYRDKAGGYGIQDAAGSFVSRVEGSDTNVVGLPLARLVVLARQVGARLLPA